ncbi:MAG: hypothetical protein ACFB0B_11990 [Thermonemataceae bacterium]
MNYFNRLLHFNQIQIIIAQEKVYLVNHTQLTLDRLVYTTWAMSQQGNWMAMSKKNYYEVKDLPPQSALMLEDIDPYEIGKIFYRLEYAKIGEEELVLNFTLNKERQYHQVADHLLVDRMIALIKSEEGFIKEVSPVS